VSLKAILLLSDDYLSDHEEDNKMSNSSMPNLIPLNLACDQQTDDASQTNLHIEHNVVPMHMRNQIQLITDRTEPTPINEGNVPAIATSCESPIKKRRREEHVNDESDEALNHDGCFHANQAGQWDERFHDLCLYREKHGNCLVPHTYTENLPLTRWVKRQRYQYKLMMECKSSTMNKERVNALDEIGFVWDVHGAAWGERLDELKKFRSIYMHCSVPSNYRANPQLASWVKCQRHQYKVRIEGKASNRASNMTPQRIRDLEAVGFEWLPRSTKKQSTMKTEE
jgi:hypothetical protein